jgi:hypothetical protein
MFVFSKHHWLQVCLKAPRTLGGPAKLSQAHAIPPYSSSQQLAEIVRDDPTALWTDYSTSDDLPGDLQTIAERDVRAPRAQHRLIPPLLMSPHLRPRPCCGYLCDASGLCLEAARRRLRPCMI